MEESSCLASRSAAAAGRVRHSSSSSVRDCPPHRWLVIYLTVPLSEVICHCGPPGLLACSWSSVFPLPGLPAWLLVGQPSCKPAFLLLSSTCKPFLSTSVFIPVNLHLPVGLSYFLLKNTVCQAFSLRPKISSRIRAGYIFFFIVHTQVYCSFQIAYQVFCFTICLQIRLPAYGLPVPSVAPRGNVNHSAFVARIIHAEYSMIIAW